MIVSWLHFPCQVSLAQCRNSLATNRGLDPCGRYSVRLCHFIFSVGRPRDM